MRHGMVKKDVLIATDKTKMERCDRNPDLARLIRFKGRGTGTAEACITARTVGCPKQTNVACLPPTKDTFSPDFVRKLPG